MELGAAIGERRQSRLAICRAQKDPAVIRPFLEPVAGTWFDNHVSTVAHDFRLRGGLALLVFNGAKLVESAGKWTNRWAVGLGLLNGDNHLFWWTGEPIITPPEGIEPGPGGQLIAFGSDARLTQQASGV